MVRIVREENKPRKKMQSSFTAAKKRSYPASFYCIFKIIIITPDYVSGPER